MNIFLFIMLFTLGQGYVLAFFLFASKFYRSTANSWLALFAILLSTFSILDVIGGHYRADSLVAEFFLSDISLDFLIYVPLYIYFKYSSLTGKISIREISLLCAPFFIDTLFNIYLVTNYSITEIINSQSIQTFYTIESVVIIFFNLYLCYKSYQIINNASSVEKRKWLLKVWRSSFMILLAFTIVTFVAAFTGVEFNYILLIIYASISIWLFWIIYGGVVNLNLIEDRAQIRNRLSETQLLNQSHLPTEEVQMQVAEAVTPIKQEITEKRIKTDTIDNHFQAIETIVTNEYLYRDENLNIDEVSDRVGLSVSYVSQIINQIIGMNFPSWINTLRIMEVKDMLRDREFENYTVVAIGLEAGFKSKSAFYASFKKITGVTPTQFRKNPS